MQGASFELHISNYPIGFLVPSKQALWQCGSAKIVPDLDLSKESSRKQARLSWEEENRMNCALRERSRSTEEESLRVDFF